jgi:hypothetical protein
MKVEQITDDSILSSLLAELKKELEESGEVTQKIVWQVNGLIIITYMEVPFEKYRFFRDVSEVAKQVGAEGILYLADAYTLDENGNLSGPEALSATYINPDGSCTTESVYYTRTKRPQGKDLITFVPPPTDRLAGEPGQNLIPAWGTYITN